MNINPVADSKGAFSQTMRKCSFVCSLMVIFIHAHNLEIYKISSEFSIYWIELFLRDITSCAVPFFFMSSAFFLYQKERGILSTYKSRCKSLLIPYFLWNTIYMILFSVLKKFSLSNLGMDEISLINILKGIFLYEYNAVYWFMFQLILFVLLYPILKLLVCRNKYICFSVFAVLLVVDYVNIFNHSIVNSLMYYYLGALCGYYYKEQISKITILPTKKKVTFITLCVVGFALTFVLKSFGINITTIRNLMVIVLMLLVLSFSKLRISSALLTLSFMIYSMHLIILECVEKLIFIVFPHNALWATVDYFAAPAITLIIVVALCIVMKKWFPRGYEVLNGNR